MGHGSGDPILVALDASSWQQIFPVDRPTRIRGKIVSERMHSSCLEMHRSGEDVQIKTRCHFASHPLSLPWSQKKVLRLVIQSSKTAAKNYRLKCKSRPVSFSCSGAGAKTESAARALEVSSAMLLLVSQRAAFKASITEEVMRRSASAQPCTNWRGGQFASIFCLQQKINRWPWEAISNFADISAKNDWQKSKIFSPKAKIGLGLCVTTSQI